MSDELDQNTEYEDNASIWQNGKSISGLASSSHSMHQVRKDIIKYALSYDIRDIRTYAGYKGDLLVEITSLDLDVLKSIQAWAENLEMETVIKENVMTSVHELFCITPDEDVYDLAEPS